MAHLIGWAFRLPWSWWALGAVVAAAAVLAGPVAARSGWGRPATRMVVLGLGVPLIPTLVARIGYFDLSLALHELPRCATSLRHPWFSDQELLNLALLMPLGVGLVWATRSAWLSCCVLVLWGGTIELTQSVTGLGACESDDMLRYALGGVAVALAARAVQQVGEAARHRRPALSGVPGRAGQPQ